jgi:hypothetical protein
MPFPGFADGWIHGNGANLNGVPLSSVMRGFGDRLVWEFDLGNGERHSVSSVDMVHGGPSIASAPRRLRRALDELREDHALNRAGFVSLWVTPDWNTSWYPPKDLQDALDGGLTPVFLDWFFGDGLLAGEPRANVPKAIDRYADHSRRFGRFLGQFDGDILIVMEPELNKPSIEGWPEFGEIIRKHGIAQIRAGVAEINEATGRKTNVFFGVALNDNGLRSASIPDDVYGTKAQGDSYGWTLSRPLLEVLRPDLDFVGFQQVLGQFHRDPEHPSRPKANTAGEVGLQHFAERVLNYSDYLHTQLGIPVFIPYVGLATSTWSDRNGNGLIEQGEIEALGWETEVGSVLSDLRDLEPALKDAGVFGLGTMSLFDDPVHDLGGYQYLLDNEYALGLVATDAENGVPGETFGAALEPKQLGRISFVRLFFGKP